MDNTQVIQDVETAVNSVFNNGKDYGIENDMEAITMLFIECLCAKLDEQFGSVNTNQFRFDAITFLAK